jgi:predicted alpha/beta hydrolase family esterase
MNQKVMLIHGSLGCTKDSFWFPYVREELKNLGLHVIAETFPDNQIAHAAIWLPYIEKLGADENTIIIGHSSGAIAAMRYVQTHKLLGSILVSAYHTDLGDADEKESGYFSTPWDWEAIRQNQKWIAQFASTDDPFIPIEEARHIKEKLHTGYHEYSDQGHFGIPVDKKEFPEIVSVVKTKLRL